MKDISFDYSAEEASPKRNIPRVGRSFLRQGGILEDALEKGVFSRDIEGLFTTLVKEAESKQRSTMCVLGFLDSSSWWNVRFVEAWSLFSNIYYIRLIFLIPRWRVSVFTKEFKRFLFNFYKISLSRCKSAPTKMWIRTSFRSETKEEIPASTLLPFSLPFPPLIPRRVNSDGKRIKLFSPLENREPAGSFPFCPAKKFDRRRLTLWLPRFIFNEIFFRHALIF